jgi:uncharacterized membrane protein
MTGCPHLEQGRSAFGFAQDKTELPRGYNHETSGNHLTFFSLIVLYSAARVLEVFPGGVPMLAIVALHVLPPLVFAWMHGTQLYGWRGMLTFFAICLVIGNVVENVGVLTGFPFGRYYFTDAMGPKIFLVPIFLGLAYLGMGYLSWTLARVIVGDPEGPLLGPRVVTVPLVGALIMTAWDFCQDPIWGTVVHAWVWVHGGSYFGVPVSNFVGWYLHVYVLYQLFALYLRGRPVTTATLTAGYWRFAVIFYGVSAAGNLLLLIPAAEPSLLTDGSGREWTVASITAACAAATVLTMGVFSLWAWMRIGGRKAPRVQAVRVGS